MLFQHLPKRWAGSLRLWVCSSSEARCPRAERVWRCPTVLQLWAGVGGWVGAWKEVKAGEGAERATWELMPFIHPVEMTFQMHIISSM